MWETQFWSLGQEDPLEEGMATHSSILAWKTSWTEEPDGLQSMRFHRVWHNWATDTHTHTHHFSHQISLTAGKKKKKNPHIFLKETPLNSSKGKPRITAKLTISFLTSSFRFSSVAQLCPTLCDPMNHSMPGLPVHHQLPEFTQTHVHWVSDAIQPSHPLSSPSPPTFKLSQHQGLFKWVSSSHQVTKGLEFQLQHQSFQWTPRTDLL